MSVDLAFVATDPVRAADTGYTAAYVIIDNKAPNSGSCESPDMSVSALPSSNAVNIALAKRSRIVAGSEMPPFFRARFKANGGDPADSSWRVSAAA